MRVKVHVDQAGETLTPSVPHITVCSMDGTIIERCRKIKLIGVWTLRQYRNPVPCGASVVLYTDDDDSTYKIEAHE